MGYVWQWLMTPLISVLFATNRIIMMLLFTTDCHLYLNRGVISFSHPEGMSLSDYQNCPVMAVCCWGAVSKLSQSISFLSSSHWPPPAESDIVHTRSSKGEAYSLFGPGVCFTTVWEVYSGLCSHSTRLEWVSLPWEELSWAGNVLWEDEGTVSTTTGQQLTHRTVSQNWSCKVARPLNLKGLAERVFIKSCGRRLLNMK